MKKIRVVLTLPAQIDYLPVTHTTVKVFAEKCGFEESKADSISLALEEAFTHTLEMGYKGVKDELKITLSSTSMGLKIVIQSKGLPLNPDHLPEYNPKNALKSQDTSGLSFLLVKKLMDKVSFSVLPNGKRQLTMLKHLPLAGTDKEIYGEKACKKKADTDAAVKAMPKVCHHIRLAVPEDAEDIARIAMLSHGSILFHEDIYYPKRVREMIQSKQMVSAVAVTDNNILFGHGALVSPDPESLVEEQTYGFINPEFRSMGALSDIALFLMDNARTRGVYAIQALSVTSHIHSQKAILKYGFIETALLLATSAGASKWRENNTQAPDRIGNLLQVNYLGSLKTPTLFAPVRHQNIIQEIYNQIDQKILVSTREEEPVITVNESKISSKSDLMEGWSLICVLEYGKDVEERIDKLVCEAITLDLPSIQLLLPLDSPATPFFTPKFETRGFFFAGVGPGDDTKEYLALQYINWEDPGYDSLHVVEGMGQKIKTYVIDCGKNAIKPYTACSRQCDQLCRRNGKENEMEFEKTIEEQHKNNGYN